MFYELRIYETLPMRLAALIDRFGRVNTRLFERHGFRPIGFWREEVGMPNRLVYLLAWEVWEERERAWAAFYADPEWQETIAQEGPTVERITNSFLRPLPFSPLR